MKTDHPITKISAVMIVKNAQNTLRQSLDSLSQFAEVVIYDNGSTDQTLPLASKYYNVKIFQGDFLGFGPTKNHAVSLASNDWVFSLDSDEILSRDLVTELKTLTLDSPNKIGVVKRDNFFLGKKINHSGWNNDWIIRLFHRGYHRFNDQQVHEKVETTPQSQRIKMRHPVKHLAVIDIGQFLVKINRYSEIRMKTSKKTMHPLLIFGRAFYTFINIYFLKLGWIDGWRGLVIAVSGANGVFYKYMKIYAKVRTQ